MKRSAKRIAVALLIVCVYIFALPDPTRSELTLTALWATTPALAPVTPSETSTLMPFDADSVFAYLDENGNVTYRGRPAFRVAMSSRGFINYGQGAEQLVLQDTRGDFVASLPLSGYPVFVGDRLFVVSEAGGAISEWTMNGTELWRRNLVAPLLSLAAGEDHAALGLVAGGPFLLTRDGSLLELQTPSTRVEPIVYAVEVSETSGRFAVIAGIPLGESRMTDAMEVTLTLFDFDSGRGIPVVRQRIARDQQAEPLVRLVDGGAVLRYSDIRDDQVLVSLTIESGDESVVRVSYPPVAVVEIDRPGMQAILSVATRRDPSRGFAIPAELVISTSNGIVPVRSSWAGGSSTIAQHGTITTIRIDDRVLAFAVGVE